MPQGEGGTRTFKLFKGVEASTGKMTFNENTSIQMEFTLVAVASTDAGATSTIIAGNSKVDELSSTQVLSPNATMGSIVIDGITNVAADDNKIAYTELIIEFGITGKAAQGQIANNNALGISRGSMVPIITAQIYITDNFQNLINAVQKSKTFSLKIGPMGEVDDHKYEILFPKCELVGADPEFAEEGSSYQSLMIYPVYSTTGFMYSDAKGTVQVKRYVP